MKVLGSTSEEQVTDGCEAASLSVIEHFEDRSAMQVSRSSSSAESCH